MFCFPLPSFSFTDFISSSSNGAIWNKSEERRKLGTVQFVFVNLTMNFSFEFFRLCGSYLFRNWCYFFFISFFFFSAFFRLMLNEWHIMHSSPFKVFVFFFENLVWIQKELYGCFGLPIYLIWLARNKYLGLKSTSIKEECN